MECFRIVGLIYDYGSLGYHPIDMSFEEQLPTHAAFPERPRKNRQEPKVELPESFPSHGGMGDLLKHFGVEPGDVEFESSKFPSVDVEVDLKTPPMAHAKKIPQHPGLMEEKNHDAYFLALEEVSPKEKEQEDPVAILDRERQFEPPPGFYAADRIEGPAPDVEVEFFDEAVPISEGLTKSEQAQREGVDSEVPPRESGIRMKAAPAVPSEAILIEPKRRGNKELVEGDPLRAPFKPSILEEDDDEELTQRIVRAITENAEETKKPDSGKGEAA